MSMLRAAAIAFIAVFSLAAQAGQVWKCQEGERIIFSDTPCPTTGKAIPARKLQANVVQSEPVSDSYEPRNDTPGRLLRSGNTTSAARATPPAAAPTNVCPSEQEIRNIETKMSSITLGKREKAFLDDEIRRARQCRKGEGNYSGDDWRLSREARDNQNNLTQRETARRRAEGMHSAADPIEGDRIANKRALEEAARIREEERRHREAEARVANTVTNCDARGCQTPRGYYTQTPGTNLLSGPGGGCRLVDRQMVCP